VSIALYSAAISILAKKELHPIKAPFAISGQVFRAAETVVVYVTASDVTGRGEAYGVYYCDETADTMLGQVYDLSERLPDKFDRHSLQTLMPPGGARNALDCALWDLESKLSGLPVWQLAGLPKPKAVRTTITLGVDAPHKMAEEASSFRDFRSIKVKIADDGLDDERLRAIRHARPDVWLGVDANQGLDADTLAALYPVFIETNVSLIEQPLKRGHETAMDAVRAPIFLAADESVQGLNEVDALVGRFDVINIKLDKCGSLTEAIAIIARARELRLRVMVGCMLGTSRSMAPAWLLAQSCDYVDLDGPVILRDDRHPAVTYENGMVSCPAALWGAP
jgi:L-Ala-D/L-Glu epimerase